MIYVNGLKYACEACVKGHRSSSCSHTDRPLFEIKKKGRPVTQCEHCRQLRKTKQVHVKCSCEAGADDEKKEPRGKAKRKMPTSAVFPDGLNGQSVSPSPAPQQKAKGSTPNGCECKSTGRCACATPVTKNPHRSRPRAPSSDDSCGPATPPLAALSSCCSGKSKTGHDSQRPVTDSYPATLLDELTYAAPQPTASTSHDSSVMYGPPAISSVSASTTFSWPSGVGVGVCSCGVTCACPGCIEHADPSTVLMSSESCPYACTTCSSCNGFGFAPVPPSESTQQSAWGVSDGSREFQTLETWSSTNPALLSSFASTSASPSLVSSDCCGGSCKCAAQALACHCTTDCCGCCFGCSCSDSESAGGATVDREEDAREPLRFAVSGERGSCCTDSKGQDCRDDDEGNDRKRKRRKLEERCEDGGVNLYPSQAFAETPTHFGAPLASTVFGAHNLESSPLAIEGIRSRQENRRGGGSGGGTPLDQWIPKSMPKFQ